MKTPKKHNRNFIKNIKNSHFSDALSQIKNNNYFAGGTYIPHIIIIYT